MCPYCHCICVYGICKTGSRILSQSRGDIGTFIQCQENALASHHKNCRIMEMQGGGAIVRQGCLFLLWKALKLAQPQYNCERSWCSCEQQVSIFPSSTYFRASGMPPFPCVGKCMGPSQGAISILPAWCCIFLAFPRNPAFAAFLYPSSLGTRPLQELCFRAVWDLPGAPWSRSIVSSLSRAGERETAAACTELFMFI